MLEYLPSVLEALGLTSSDMESIHPTHEMKIRPEVIGFYKKQTKNAFVSLKITQIFQLLQNK